MAKVKYHQVLWALFWCSLTLFSDCECQKTNGTTVTTTTLLMQKTSFSCAGRPAGYYADVETGCQIYHMCDGLGRQFSYSCPNTTLFQQRMLICDHWYMVNCSKAESNYAANLLIGQRDKPFVNDEENNLRTPRPDLLDRPYAPDYSGESFRSQYKQLTASQNQIRDDTDKSANKLLQFANSQSQTRWRIPPPSRTILPPAYEPQIEYSSSTSSPSTTTQRPPRTTLTTTRKVQSFTQRTVLNEALHSRKPTLLVDTDDLGTSHSTRYNTSADFNSAEVSFKPQKPTTTKLLIKTPSKIYEPPFLYPIYNQDDEQQSSSDSIKGIVRTSTAAPFSAAVSRVPTVRSTTNHPIMRPTTHAGQPFSTPSPPTTTGAVRLPLAPIRTEARTPTPAQSFRPPATTAAPQQKQFSVDEKPQLPFNDLLPPFVEFVPYDVATTQGPPIYYEWKVPSYGLEPPKLDPPIGVDGREYPETINDYTQSSAAAAAATNKINEISVNKNKPVTRVPIVRSIKTEAVAQSVTEKAQRRADGPVFTDITKLRKDLSIPEYAFPLETIGRTGYGAGDVYNSFQLKIPERRSNGDGKIQWFGENPKCPECHPSFVKPGTCEPCLRR